MQNTATPLAFLAESADDVAQIGSVADFLEVEAGYERAVEACLGDLLQHVVVPTHGHAQAGLQFARAKEAGRVGFLVAAAGASVPVVEALDGLLPLRQVARVGGAAADAINAALSGMWIASTFEAGRDAAALTTAPIATLDGDVFRGPQVWKGRPGGARGILTTKREIKGFASMPTASGSSLNVSAARSPTWTWSSPARIRNPLAAGETPGRRRGSSATSSRSAVRARLPIASHAS